MRILLLDGDWPDAWAFSGNRFGALARILAAAGHDVALINVAATKGAQAGEPTIDLDAAGGPPVLTGLGRAIGAAPLIRARGLAARLSGTRADLILCPLRGGLAHGLLLARACGEEFAGTSFALWYDGLSATSAMDECDAQMAMANLVADALERQCLAMADVLVGPREASGDASLPPPALLPRIEARLPLGDARHAAHPGVREIVFAGPLSRSAGIDDFIHAVERLSATRALSLTFAIPEQPAASTLGKEWLGHRVASLPARFRVVDCSSLVTAKALVSRHDQLGVTMVNERRAPEYFSADGGVQPRAVAHDQPLHRRIEIELTGILDGPDALHPGTTVDDWPDLVGRLARAAERPRTRRALPSGVSVCILHFNRLEKLAQALASVPLSTPDLPIDLLVIDNASTVADARLRIGDLIDGRADARMLALDQPIPQAAAYNLGMSRARHDTVIFLDDDNLFHPDGVRRMATAIGHGDFDVLVTNLDLFEDHAGPSGETIAQMVFLGEAHSAGLFFNGFGDTAMAVRRDAFLAAGGFHDPGREYPCLDWVTLAAAHARGLRIGVLQRPAIRYRRNSHPSGFSARKLNQEEARALVLRAYGASIDAGLVARYAQLQHAASV